MTPSRGPTWSQVEITRCVTLSEIIKSVLLLGLVSSLTETGL